MQDLTNIQAIVFDAYGTLFAINTINNFLIRELKVN